MGAGATHRAIALQVAQDGVDIRILDGESLGLHHHIPQAAAYQRVAQIMQVEETAGYSGRVVWMQARAQFLECIRTNRGKQQ